jgi:ribosomal protein L30/L7E
MLQAIKKRIQRAVGQFALNRAKSQVRGMIQEAKDVVTRTQGLATRSPLRFAALFGLGALLACVLVRVNRDN